ncbi:HAD-IB family hydrolase [Glycomyces luteolus]|uniref:HAD-IB family hydrolase n=1 Tax=Glycomyces luteolus TaxID=2670330 RepID=A0A9X3SP16_9ACTN|nr:HAD-IB family hydrolase [Glycomyces luteolus]MDA1358872.1 HAD-IB family hydrolase [Glycomyces luteolus]
MPMQPSTDGESEFDAAFFDVDETLLASKSMFRFLRFYLRRKGEPELLYERLAGELSTLAAAGVPREEVNRAYYRLYAGESAELLATVGREWFEDELSDPGFLLEAPVAEHAELRARGVPTHLVSGSFFACLEPAAALLGASETHGPPLQIRRGLLTGEIDYPVIGRGKAETVQAVARLRGYRLDHCIAYGDHATDLPMLETTGTAVVVGDDAVLRRRADAAAWRTLPQTPRTAPLERTPARPGIAA